MIKQNKFLSLKDYEFSLEVDAKSRSEAFQNTSIRCLGLKQDPIG